MYGANSQIFNPLGSIALAPTPTPTPTPTPGAGGAIAAIRFHGGDGPIAIGLPAKTVLSEANFLIFGPFTGQIDLVEPTGAIAIAHCSPYLSHYAARLTWATSTAVSLSLIPPPGPGEGVLLLWGAIVP